MKPETKQSIGNMASLADLIQEAREAAQPGVLVGRPEGGITIREYATAMGLCREAARRDLEGLVEKGQYERVLAVAPTTAGGSGRILKQMFYRRKVKNAMDRVR